MRVELHADLDAEQAFVGWLLGKILVAEALQCLEKIRGFGKLGQALCELCALALADAGDQRFLAVEIEVERAGADRGLLADVLHGGAVESGAGEAAFGGVEDVLAAGALDVGFQARHCGKIVVAVHNKKRTVVLFRWSAVNVN